MNYKEIALQLAIVVAALFIYDKWIKSKVSSLETDSADELDEM